MGQWRAAKRQHPNAIILFRMGDFYETFEDDAKIASEVLGIALTKRSNSGRSGNKGPATDIPLAGFPYHSLENYLHKLLRAGHRVAICEQVEDPKLAKGIVRREVVEVLTPGTANTEQFLEQGENNYLAALVPEGKETGLALLDNSTGDFRAAQLPRGEIGEVLRRYRPSEVLVAEGHQAELEALLQASGALVTTFPDWICEEINATDELTRHFGTSSLKGFGIADLPLAVGAAGAVIHYIYANLPGAKPHISALRTFQDEDSLILDDFTVRNLELFHSLATQGTHGTLISVIDRTRTAAGARLLKQWLRTPSHDRQAIDRRLDRVAALVADGDLREDLQAGLAGTSDLERIVGRLATGRATPRDAANVAQTLELLEQLVRLTADAGATPLSELLESRPRTADLVTLIRSAIADDPPVLLSKGGVIRAGHSADLDALRKLAGSGKTWMVELQASERERTGIPSLKIGYNNVFGYYLEVTRTHQDKVPENYIRKQTLVNAERYITPELKEQEESILAAEDKIALLEKELFDILQQEILARAADIQANAALLARLDNAAGLAQVAVRGDYVRPVLEESRVLSLKDSRHPVVETLLPTGESFTPNDLQMDPAESQIHIITGPNMSGKSTYLRQVGLCVVLAHMGSYVPASAARIGLVDRLFTRVGASDNLAGGESTFLVEMVETANILHNASTASLILLDEIGRGTSTHDGLSLAWAITEYLHQHGAVAAKTIFATHYHELVALADVLPRVRNFNVAVREHGQEVVFLRKIVPGGTDRSYGIHVARMAGLPRWIIERAAEILATLGGDGEEAGPRPLPAAGTPPGADRQSDDQIDLFAVQEQALKEEFQKIDVQTLTPLEALNLLDSLKKKHGL